MQKRGQEVNIHDLMTDILERDNKDMRRDISPLKNSDAFTIDSSNLSSEQVLNNAINEIKKRTYMAKPLLNCLMKRAN